MATQRKEAPAETGVLQDKPNAQTARRGDHDRIVMASRRADGSMAQIDPEFIGDKGIAEAAAKQQLAQQAASAVDVAARGATANLDGAGGTEPDAEVKALKDAQEGAVRAAVEQGAREVEERHQGLGG